MTDASPNIPNAHTLRRLLPEDAPGLVQLVRGIYGDSFYPPDLYDAQRIIELNQTGKLVSIVALDSANKVVGHYALERPNHETVAEASDAIVAVEHRHHQLMEQMRPLLREQAVRLGLAGMVGYPVTNHLYSQKAEEHFGAHPVGIALGLWPATYHNMPESLPQRMSFVLYFQLLRPATAVAHTATRHSAIIARIYGRLGVEVQLSEGSLSSGKGEIETCCEPEVQTGTIRIRRVGSDTATAVQQARRDLCEKRGAKAITLELPLSDPSADEGCRAAEEAGFFFGGLGPVFAEEGDILMMQYLVEKLDPALVQIDDPFAKELLAYAGCERERVGK